MTYATSAHATHPALISGVTNADLAATILRVSMGGLFLAHAWLKLVIFTPAGTADSLKAWASPASWPIWSSPQNLAEASL